MPSSIPDQLNYGSYIPSTYIFDVQQLYSADVTSPEFKELLIRLYQNINSMLLSLNAKDAGMYELQEFINGQVFFSDPALSSTTQQQPTPRQVFRKVINFGALPNAATKSVAHGITTTANFSFTRIYGCATDSATPMYIPLPYSSATAVANNIEITVDGTNVNVITGVDYSAYTITYIILEFIKQ